MTYRGDVGATPSENGMRMWGLTEWKDLDAAIVAAQRKGAKDFVVIGSGSGASVVSTYLHEADDISAVRAVTSLLAANLRSYGASAAVGAANPLLPVSQRCIWPYLTTTPSTCHPVKEA